MQKTQLDMIFDMTKECPECKKTELTDKDKELILFKNKCQACVDEEVGETMSYVVECIVKGYGYDVDKSKAMLEAYDFKSKLLKNPDYILHYNLEYWADEIVKQYQVVT